MSIQSVEKHIKMRLMNYLKYKKFALLFQYGFRDQRNTSNSLVGILTTCFYAIELQGYTCILLMDKKSIRHS